LLGNSGHGDGDNVLLGCNNLYEGSEGKESTKILDARGVIISLDPKQSVL
jgi:hypothetical protein